MGWIVHFHQGFGNKGAEAQIGNIQVCLKTDGKDALQFPRAGPLGIESAQREKGFGNKKATFNT